MTPPHTVDPGSRLRRTVCVACIALLPLSAPTWAEPNVPTIDLRGFGTLGLARSSSSEVHFVRDLSQPDGSHGNWTTDTDSVLGVQANIRVNNRLEALIQGVSRTRYDGSHTPEVNWAFARWSATPTLNLRVGRLGTEFYMLSDSRLVGYSSLAVRPAGDFFGALPFYHFDGLDLQASHALGDGVLRGKLFGGWSHETLNVGSRTWTLDGSRFTGGYLDWLHGPWQWRLSYADIRYARDFAPDFHDQLKAAGAHAASAALDLTDKLARYYSIGALYDDGPWQVQLMISRTTPESLTFENGRMSYIQVGYHLGEFTPYIGHSRWKTDPKTRPAGVTGVLVGQVDALMADSHSDQHTTTLGVRWDFRENMDLKLQWDRIRGDPSSIFPYRRETPAWNGRTDVFSLALDFVF